MEQDNMIAALFVDSAGAYTGLPGVDAWDEQRDARKYAGPHPVVAHSPCQRWGKYWHGAPCKPHQFRLGEDGGCFAAALTAVRNYGGVLEHPKDSRAWKFFGLTTPPITGGWVKADDFGGWTCCVWQGHYGHFAGKGTWLYAVVKDPTHLPALTWGPSDSGPTPEMIERYGYAKARRVGRMALVGGKDKTRIREATPPPIPRPADRHCPPGATHRSHPMTTPLDQARAISEEALDQIMRAAMQSDYGYAFVGDRDYPNGRDDLRAAVDKAWQAAIASRAVPEGWKLVPIKPTDEMMGAVVSSMDEHLMGKDGAEAQYREDWAAMLRAAPTPQAPPIAAKAAKETTA